jgi:hypothetical protein
VFSPPDCTGVLQPLDWEIFGSLKHYYQKELVRKTISVIEHKLVHDAAVVEVMFWMHNIAFQNDGAAAYI